MHETEPHLAALFGAARTGDNAAYHRFLQACAQRLRGWLRQRLRASPDEIEDVVQEILLALHNQRASYLDGQPFAAWLFAIARYKLIDNWRRHGWREKLHEPLDDALSPLTAEPVEAEGTRRDLNKLLAMLPDKQREPIQLVKLCGLSIREAAEQTGLSEPAVKIGIHRGLKALAALIRRET